MLCFPPITKFCNNVILGRETVRKVERLHVWDVARANKAPFAFGIEPRVPFLDKAFLETSMSIDPQDKMVSRGMTDCLSSGVAHVPIEHSVEMHRWPDLACPCPALPCPALPCPALPRPTPLAVLSLPSVRSACAHSY